MATIVMVRKYPKAAVSYQVSYQPSPRRMQPASPRIEDRTTGKDLAEG